MLLHSEGRAPGPCPCIFTIIIHPSGGKGKREVGRRSDGAAEDVLQGKVQIVKETAPEVGSHGGALLL